MSRFSDHFKKTWNVSTKQGKLNESVKCKTNIWNLASDFSLMSKTTRVERYLPLKSFFKVAMAPLRSNWTTPWNKLICLEIFADLLKQ